MGVDPLLSSTFTIFSPLFIKLARRHYRRQIRSRQRNLKMAEVLGEDGLPVILSQIDGLPIETLAIHDFGKPPRTKTTPDWAAQSESFYKDKYRKVAHQYPREVQKYIIERLRAGDVYITPTARSDPCQHKQYKPLVAYSKDNPSAIQVARHDGSRGESLINGDALNENRVVFLTLLFGYHPNFKLMREAARQTGVSPETKKYFVTGEEAGFKKNEAVPQPPKPPQPPKGPQNSSQAQQAEPYPYASLKYGTTPAGNHQGVLPDSMGAVMNLSSTYKATGSIISRNEVLADRAQASTQIHAHLNRLKAIQRQVTYADEAYALVTFIGHYSRIHLAFQLDRVTVADHVDAYINEVRDYRRWHNDLLQLASTRLVQTRLQGQVVSLTTRVTAIEALFSPEIIKQLPDLISSVTELKKTVGSVDDMGESLRTINNACEDSKRKYDEISTEVKEVSYNSVKSMSDLAHASTVGFELQSVALPDDVVQDLKRIKTAPEFIITSP